MSRDFSLDTVVYIRFEVLVDTAGSYTINIPYVCQRCGNCCVDNTFPGNEQDLQNIASFLGTTAGELIEKHSYSVPNEKPRTTLPETYPCGFYSENRCTIYPVRPAICRTWFFRVTDELKKEKEVLTCPASSHLIDVCQSLLEGLPYRVGIREILSIGDKNPDPTIASVTSFDEIQGKIAADYNPPDEDQVKRIRTIYRSFKPTDREKQVFIALNPALSDF